MGERNPPPVEHVELPPLPEPPPPQSAEGGEGWRIPVPDWYRPIALRTAADRRTRIEQRAENFLRDAIRANGATAGSVVDADAIWAFDLAEAFEAEAERRRQA